ncbi:MAG: non-homologous end-joining DNA ligase [Actinomycetota bacterium]
MEAIEVEVDGRLVRVSNPDKVFFTRRGETKLDLIDYYLAVGSQMMAVVGGRPALMQRFPDGASGKNFFQKRVPKGAPEWLQTTVVSTPNGTTSDAIVLADLAHVAWAAQMGSLCFHVWPYPAAQPEIADELRIDLDPHGGVTFDDVRWAAHQVHDFFGELGIRSWVKTTGSKGLHVFVRLAAEWDSYQVRAAAVALARELERRHPDRLTAAWWKEERGDRVFIDFNQNAPHKTVFGAWSVRPRVGAQVSMPIRWDQVDTIDPQALTIATVPNLVEAEGDAWIEYATAAERLEPLLELHERDMADGLMDAPWPPVYPKQPNEPPRVAPSRARAVDPDA